jgi:hypothetical protein
VRQFGGGSEGIVCRKAKLREFIEGGLDRRQRCLIGAQMFFDEGARGWRPRLAGFQLGNRAERVRAIGPKCM